MGVSLRLTDDGGGHEHGFRARLRRRSRGQFYGLRLANRRESLALSDRLSGLGRRGDDPHARWSSACDHPLGDDPGGLRPPGAGLIVRPIEILLTSISAAALALLAVLVLPTGDETAFQHEVGESRATEAPREIREVHPGHYEAIVHAYEGGFEPSEIRVPVGSTVTFKVLSSEDYHGFAIQAADVNLSLAPGIAEEVVHTFGDTSVVYYYCTVYCGNNHYAMLGKIVVE
ncbi:MAG: hypothetical protein GEU90_18780 [Gemmatimonas sp.]|nr:hypothetical protein [Gemmatimonas sp.]